MNHRVPDFYEMDEDCSIPTPSGYSRHKKPATGDEEIMELLWQNGPVVVHSQNQRPSRRSSTTTAFGSGSESVPPSDRDIRSNNNDDDDEHLQNQHQHHQQHLFIQEDEMASWLQYPLEDSSFDRDFYADLLYSAPPPPPPVATVAPPIRPLPPPRQPSQNTPRLQNFMQFSRIPSRPAARVEPVPRPIVTVARESAVVESNETPMVRHAVADSSNSNRNQMLINAESATTAATSASAGNMATGTCELAVTSSPGGSAASFSTSGDPHQQQRVATVAEDRKRKGPEADENDCQSEDIEYEATEAKKPARGSTSTKRSRAAEVHNLSERRRRDRINEKMKALQELIPRCNKSDKASMLDEAIEYLKSLQMQVQMMSMGCGIVPMMYPGMQQYMRPMGMGMGMGMDMAMNRPMVPYPHMVPGQAMPNPAAHMAPPQFPMPAFHIPQVDPSRMRAPNQTDHPMLSSGAPLNPNQPQIPNFVDPYQQFRGLHQTQIPLPHNQAMLQPDGNKPSTSKEGENPENRQTG